MRTWKIETQQSIDTLFPFITCLLSLKFTPKTTKQATC